MKRVALGVTKQSGKWILNYLATHPGVKIVAVDSAIDRPGQIDCSDEIKWLKLPHISHLEMAVLKPYLFINISYPKIIKKELLDSCTCINLHMGKLPEYRGRNTFAHAIQNGDKEFTVTLHLMTEGIDEGDIIAERVMPIYSIDTSKSLHDRAELVSYNMFIEELPKILSGKFETRPQIGIARYYGKEIDKEIDMNNSAISIYNKIRSLDFPPYEPAYYVEDGRRINSLFPLWRFQGIAIF